MFYMLSKKTTSTDFGSTVGKELYYSYTVNVRQCWKVKGPTDILFLINHLLTGLTVK